MFLFLNWFFCLFNHSPNFKIYNVLVNVTMIRYVFDIVSKVGNVLSQKSCSQKYWPFLNLKNIGTNFQSPRILREWFRGISKKFIEKWLSFVLTLWILTITSTLKTVVTKRKQSTVLLEITWSPWNLCDLHFLRSFFQMVDYFCQISRYLIVATPF